MFWIEISTILAAALFVLVFVQQTRLWKSKNKKKLPPGPKGFPIFGCLHMLGKFPYKDLHLLSQKYGPIMHLRLGLIPNIIVSSPQATEQFLKTHDLVFASRPPHLAAKYISYDQASLTFGQYGPYWRNMRKMCTLELLSNSKMNSFKAMRKEEVSLLIKSIEEGTIEGNVKPVDLSDKVAFLSTNMSYLMVFGKKYMESEFHERGFKGVVHEAMKLFGAFNLGDYIPFIAPFDLQGLTRRMKVVSKVFDSLLEKVIDEHLQSKDEKKTKDFVDVMLSIMGSQESEYQIERSNIKAIILDMLVASMETSSTTIEWVLSELIKHPKVMKKVQKELEHVVGMERLVDESDLESLEYLDMVVKETLRLHPVGPLLLPHAAREDCTVNGYDIPQGSRVIINAWAIGRDPSVWNDVEKFFPERFVGNNIDIRGHDFQLIPFGSGKRICPGLQLGLVIVKLVVAQLVHCFDWELPNGMLPNEVDMTEVFGLTAPRAKHLLAIPTYRLHKEVVVST